MEDLRQFLKSIGFEIAIFLAGIFGAFVSITKDKEMKRIERLTAIVSGGLIANYITPIFVKIVGLGISTSYGLGFVIGYMGLKSVEWLINYFHKKYDKK